MRYASEISKSLSCKSWLEKKAVSPTLRKPAAPCEIMQSRSISPKRRPPIRGYPRPKPRSEFTVSRTTLHRLSRKNLDGPSRTRVYFIVHHVLEALIVGRSHK